MATYVEGEDVETDSEDEQYSFNLSYMKVYCGFIKNKMIIKNQLNN